MTVFVPETVAQGFVHSTLVGTPAVVAALGNTQIFPKVAPPRANGEPVTGRHLIHDFYGPSGGERPTPLGRALSQIGLLWHITAYDPSWSMQALAPLMRAVMEALTGPDAAVGRFHYTDAGVAFYIECEYAGPEYVTMEAVPAGVWAPIRHLYKITMRAKV